MILNKTTVSKINNQTSDKALELFLDALIEYNDSTKKEMKVLINATVDQYFEEG